MFKEKTLPSIIFKAIIALKPEIQRWRRINLENGKNTEKENTCIELPTQNPPLKKSMPDNIQAKGLRFL